MIVCGVLGLGLATGGMAQTVTAGGGSVQAPGSMGEGDKGRRLLNEMVAALGGDTWLNLKGYEEDGRVAAFSKGQPTGSNVQFFEYFKLPVGERIEFATPRAIMPGSTRDIVQVWTADNGL